MQKKDVFASIADTKITVRKDLMQIKEPVKALEKYFNETDISKFSYEKEPVLSFDEEYRIGLEDYQEGILALKNQYRKYITRNNDPINPRKRIYFDEFDFRYETLEDLKGFDQVLAGQGVWEKINIPHYHGPTGKWVTYYRTVFDYETCDMNAFLVFKGSDYFTDVYLNKIGRASGRERV